MNNILKYNYNNNELLILLYHGVYDCNLKGIENYSGKHISKSNFISQLKLLKEKNFTFLSFDEIIQITKSKKQFPKNSVAISFDDGFANNYDIACPILDDYKIPAIFYVCSGLIGKDDLFWVDKIEACINNSNKNKIELSLDKLYSFVLNDNKNKIQANEKIKKFCKKSKTNIRDNILDELQVITDITPNNLMSENYKIMNWDQLAQINDNALFTIGGHNLYHDTFTNIEPTKIQNEIFETIKLLEDNLRTKTKHYSYPEGQLADYNERVISELKNQGIECCPSAIYGFNTNILDLFNLKRIMPGFMNTEFPLN